MDPFLVAPKNGDPQGLFGKHLNPQAATLSEITPETGLLVLCGEPGLGKTTELELLCDRFTASSGGKERLIHLKARDFGSSRMATSPARWGSSNLASRADFPGHRMGGAEVLKQSLAAASLAHFATEALEVLSDVDVPADLPAAEAVLEAGRGNFLIGR